MCVCVCVCVCVCGTASQGVKAAGAVFDSTAAGSNRSCLPQRPPPPCVGVRPVGSLFVAEPGSPLSAAPGGGVHQAPASGADPTAEESTPPAGVGSLRRGQRGGLEPQRAASPAVKMAVITRRSQASRGWRFIVAVHDWCQTAWIRSEFSTICFTGQPSRLR